MGLLIAGHMTDRLSVATKITSLSMAGVEKAQPTSERADATRERIVQAARELVVEHGYDGVSTGQVLARAQVSRGGLYHHFAGKDELMAAVLEAVERDFSQRLAVAVAGARDPFDALASGVQWYLDECRHSIELQRVGLYEGRKALGWQAWRDTIAPYGLAMLADGLRAAIDAGQLEDADPRALAHMILALLHEATTMILAAPDQDAERERVGASVAVMIDGLRKRPL
jgi:AcrR family transcriptional regulator